MSSNSLAGVRADSQDLQMRAALESLNAEKIERDVSYVLGANDVVKVVVYGEEDLSGSYRLAQDGTIAMPLIGDLNLLGKRVREAQNDVRDRLADGYLVDPQVSIEVQSYRPFYIMGEIQSPGRYSYASNLSVLGAIAQAGGFTDRAKQDKVRVLRVDKDTDAPRYYDLEIEQLVEPEDIILVKERFFRR